MTRPVDLTEWEHQLLIITLDEMGLKLGEDPDQEAMFIEMIKGMR